MNDAPRPDQDQVAQKRRRVYLASLEADVAYFQARLEILGEPSTANQWAQRKAYMLLRKSLGDLILQTKRRKVESGGGSR